MAPGATQAVTFRDDWELILQLVAAPEHLGSEIALHLPDSNPCTVILDPGCLRGWRASGKLPSATRQLFDLFVPLCTRPDARFTVGQLGQSVDGFIAGDDGESRGLNGHPVIVHLHRLRAVSQAVVVGRQTAEKDNPLLTTRLVPGPNPVRVVLDSGLRCAPSLRVFNDGAAETLLLCSEHAPQRAFPHGTKVLRFGAREPAMVMHEIMALLRAEGLVRVFIEGGGRTVSRSLEQGVLDHLHLAVAPLMIGSGVRGLSLPQIHGFAKALRPKCQHFSLGPDVLFDFEWEG